MKSGSIKVVKVGKKYIVHRGRPSFAENLMRVFRQEGFWALRNVNLSIMAGERWGIVGDNGSGKTTLLKLISGVTLPTTGNLNVAGRVAALFELDVGFHPELTGKENILVGGMLLGMSLEEVNQKLKVISDFSGLGDFLDTPFYTFSSGMALRLGFSIAIHSEPSILLLDDESVLVGDRRFQEQIQRRLWLMHNARVTTIVVSHNFPFLRKNTDHLCFFDKGLLIAKGKTDDILSKYMVFGKAKREWNLKI